MKQRWSDECVNRMDLYIHSACALRFMAVWFCNKCKRRSGVLYYDRNNDDIVYAWNVFNVQVRWSDGRLN
jgi:hypothetical protein